MLREKILRLLEFRGWSKRQLAEAAGVPQSTLHDAMNGAKINVYDAIRISQEIGTPVEWLFNDNLSWPDLVTKPYWWRPGEPMPTDPDREAQLREIGERVLNEGLEKLPGRRKARGA